MKSSLQKTVWISAALMVSLICLSNNVRAEEARVSLEQQTRAGIFGPSSREARYLTQQILIGPVIKNRFENTAYGTAATPHGINRDAFQYKMLRIRSHRWLLWCGPGVDSVYTVRSSNKGGYMMATLSGGIDFK